VLGTSHPPFEGGKKSLFRDEEATNDKMARTSTVEVYTNFAMLQSLRLAGWLLGPCALAASAQYDVLTFHGDRQRTGWIFTEKILTPRNVSGGRFGPVWDSPQFDSVTISGNTYLPHVYASPSIESR